MLVLKHFVPPILCIKDQKVLYKLRKKWETFEKFSWFLGRVVRFLGSACMNDSYRYYWYPDSYKNVLTEPV